MPFTISHAAAVLPFSKWGIPACRWPRLMIGSMSPDFAYFLPVGMARTSTHDLDGILLFCWPVGLALWLLFVHLLERPTIELLPAAWRVRMPRSNRTVSPEVLGFASIAVILGAMTHVAWDAFTHADTLLTGAFPALNERAIHLSWQVGSHLPDLAVPELDRWTAGTRDLGPQSAAFPTPGPRRC